MVIGTLILNRGDSTPLNVILQAKKLLDLLPAVDLVTSSVMTILASHHSGTMIGNLFTRKESALYVVLLPLLTGIKLENG